MTIYGFDLIHDVLPYVISALTLYMTWLQGLKTWKAWLFGLINQVLWLTYILYLGAWGLLPLNMGLWVLYVFNLERWYRDERREKRRRWQSEQEERVTTKVW